MHKRVVAVKGAAEECVCVDLVASCGGGGTSGGGLYANSGGRVFVCFCVSENWPTSTHWNSTAAGAVELCVCVSNCAQRNEWSIETASERTNERCSDTKTLQESQSEHKKRDRQTRQRKK